MARDCNAIPYMQIRGGSSKGLYFAKKDLPENTTLRDEMLLDILGRDERQIDGLGGANPLTSKVAIISPSIRKGCDIDYLFVQVIVGKNQVDTTPNCGNILAGVGIFALASGMLKATSDTTTIGVFMENSQKKCELVMQTPNGTWQTIGDTKIDGVPGQSAAIVCNYLDVAGSLCGALFPTGQKTDEINGIKVTCIDNGMPVILICASELGKTGYESCDELNSDANFKQTIEAIRLTAGPMMHLGDVTNKAVPKISILAAAKNSGVIRATTFIPHKCHSAIGVLGAASVASACLFDDCVVQAIKKPNIDANCIVVEHPNGQMEISLQIEQAANDIKITHVGLIRTARLLSTGVAYPAPHSTTFH